MFTIALARKIIHISQYESGKKKKDVEVLVLGQSKLTHSEKLDSEIPTFEYEMLEVATDYFSIANKLGEGGFGSVYKVFCVFSLFF